MKAEQEKFAELWHAGFTYSEIQAQLHVPHATLSTWRKRMGLPSRDLQRRSVERRRALEPELRKWAQEGLSLMEMSHRIGAHPENVKVILGKLGIQRIKKSNGDLMTGRTCVRCRNIFMHMDPPKNRRLCPSCTDYAAQHASALA